MASGIDNFEFDLIGSDKPDSERSFQGYNSQQDPTNLNARYMIRGSRNVFLKNTGTISVRPGLKLFGEVDGTKDGIVASYDWRTALGAELPIRILRSGKFQVLFQNEWIDVGTFTLTDFSFATWWDTAQSEDLLLMVNGDETIKSWTGGIAVVESSTSTTITKEGTESWLEAGFTTLNLYAVEDAVIANDGTGYAVGDKVYITQGSDMVTPAIYEVTSVSGSGDITGVVQLDGGFSTADTTGGVITATNGNGTGATFTIISNIEAAKVITINGVEYIYSGGENTTTLTGVSPDASALQAGDIAVQKILVFNGLPNTTDPNSYGARTEAFTNDFILVLNNQLMVFSYTSRVAYMSSDGDYTDFSNSGDVVDGDPDFFILDEFPVGGIVKGDSAYVAAGNSAWYVVTPNVLVATNTGVVVTKLDKQVGAVNSAAFGHNFIASIGEDIIYLSQDHQLRTLGTLRNIVTPKTPSLSKSIRQELMDADFAGGSLKVIDEFVYITSPLTSQDFMYQIRDDVDDVGNLTASRLWHPPQERNISRVTTIGGITYGYSASYPQMYQMWDTDQWHDDTPDGNAAYTCVMRMAYRQFGSRNELGSFDKVYYEGYVLDRSDLAANIYNDYQGATAQQHYILSDIDGSSVLYGGEGVTLIGGAVIGTKVIGGGVPDDNYQNPLPKFRAILNVDQADCFEYCLELRSELADSRWEMLALGPDTDKSDQNPVHLQRSS